MEEIIARGLLFLSKAGDEFLRRFGGRLDLSSNGGSGCGRANILPLTHTINSAVVNMMPHKRPGQMSLLLLNKKAS